MLEPAPEDLSTEHGDLPLCPASCWPITNDGSVIGEWFFCPECGRKLMPLLSGTSWRILAHVPLPQDPELEEMEESEYLEWVLRCASESDNE